VVVVVALHHVNEVAFLDVVAGHFGQGSHRWLVC
jgi:hypothetical protein